MAWEVEKHSRTLLIQVNNREGRNKSYSIYPWMLVERSDGPGLTGDVYMEPVPQNLVAAMLSGVMKFAKIDFVDSPSTKRDANASQMNLTRGGYNALRGPA